MTVLLNWPGMPSLAPFAPRAPAARAHEGGALLDLSVPRTVSAGTRRQFLSLRAGMAELVLLNRLRARTRQELSQETLERAARIIEVTARSWLTDGAATEAAGGQAEDSAGAGG